MTVRRVLASLAASGAAVLFVFPVAAAYADTGTGGDPGSCSVASTTGSTGDPTADPSAEPAPDPCFPTCGDATSTTTGDPGTDPGGTVMSGCCWTDSGGSTGTTSGGSDGGTIEPDPTVSATADPVEEPTDTPTDSPTDAPPPDDPTAEPTDIPTDEPTAEPTDVPTDEPTDAPGVICFDSIPLAAGGGDGGSATGGGIESETSGPTDVKGVQHDRTPKLPFTGPAEIVALSLMGTGLVGAGVLSLVAARRRNAT